MPTNRPGDVLADRYRLDDLLSESGDARFWRGYDEVLERPVAIHVIDADDARATMLMDAARSSAQLHDARLLRVLDAEADGRICYVVNEWGQGTSLDQWLVREGPLEPRHAAWVAHEVAASIAAAHDAGIAHGRLSPENILVDRNGSVRIIGFAVDAALHGMTPDPATDFEDTLGLLHCALSGTWPGASPSAVPVTPIDHDRVLRPRQIRAGVPRALDDLCDEVLNRPHGRHAGPTTVRELEVALRDYESTKVAEELQPSVDQTQVRALPTPRSTPVVTPPRLEETQAGTPIFESGEDVSWFSPRPNRPAPPPPLEPHPERPLFAEDPVRRPRTRQRRRRRTIAAALAIVLLLALAALLVVQIVRSNDPRGTTPPTGTHTSGGGGGAAGIVAGVTPKDFDPLGDPPSEYPTLVGLAVDGDQKTGGNLKTGWPTSTYINQIGNEPKSIKAGVGFYLDLHKTYSVSQVEMAFAEPGTDVSVFVSDQAPSGVPDPKKAAATITAGTKGTASVSAKGRYVLLWFTKLPKVPGGEYRAVLDEVSVTGTPAS